MPHHEPDFDASGIPLFLGPEAVGRLLEIPPIAAQLMLAVGTIKSYDVGPPGLTQKRTTLKEVIDYYNQVT